MKNTDVRKRMDLLYWIVLIDLALERPDEAKVLREMFMLKAKGILTQEDHKRFNDALRKMRRQDQKGPEESKVRDALGRLEQLEEDQGSKT